jgi:hypothetical protein
MRSRPKEVFNFVSSRRLTISEKRKALARKLSRRLLLGHTYYPQGTRTLSLNDLLKKAVLRCDQADRQLQQSSNHYCVVQCASARRVICNQAFRQSSGAFAVQIGLLTVANGGGNRTSFLSSPS